MSDKATLKIGNTEIEVQSVKFDFTPNMPTPEQMEQLHKSWADFKRQLRQTTHIFISKAYSGSIVVSPLEEDQPEEAARD